MKKKNFALSILVSLLILGGCSTLNSSDVDTEKKSEYITEINDVDDVYGFSALTSASLLSQFDMSAETNASKAMNLAWNEVGEEEIEKINYYVNLFESLLSDEGVLSSNISNSDIEEFDYMMIISTKSLLGETQSYVLYYNEVIIDVEDEIEEDITDEEEVGNEVESVDEIVENYHSKVKEVRHLDRIRDKIDEVSTLIEGIMIVGEEHYEIKGVRIAHETFTKTSFISFIDRFNYVRVSHMSNEDKENFKYRIVKDGKIESISDINVKNVESKTEIKLRLYENGSYEDYSFKKIEEEGKQLIKIRIIKDRNVIDIKVFIITDEETGETLYRYHFFDGQEFFKCRNEKIKKIKEEVKEKIKEKVKEIRDKIPHHKNHHD
ncbi:TPA: hypothetical protein GXZ54_05375 [bacterium]|nr:hypothetical protein [bacterium]